ncbi:hypothetical protein [Arcobacter sp.]|uniref:hypothetical protein n=1 Tax=unclassified Arcobacter TaxID=2593671 RepID=UPI003B005617
MNHFEKENDSCKNTDFSNLGNDIKKVMNATSLSTDKQVKDMKKINGVTVWGTQTIQSNKLREIVTFKRADLSHIVYDYLKEGK